jgi:hypothetical protein
MDNHAKLTKDQAEVINARFSAVGTGYDLDSVDRNSHGILLNDASGKVKLPVGPGRVERFLYY